MEAVAAKIMALVEGRIDGNKVVSTPLSLVKRQ